MVKSRLYNKNDYIKIMNFLKQMYKLNKNQHCWLPSRWEYAEYLVSPLYVERGEESWEKYIRIWEKDNKIIGICHIEDTYNAFIQIRPDYRDIEPEMIEWAEKTISKPIGDNKKKIAIWANDSDQYRKKILENKKYKKGDDCNYLNRQKLNKDFTPKLPKGYKFRSMDDNIDILKRYNVLNKAFHPEDDYKNQVPESFIKMTKAPMYRPDLDLIIEDSNGNFASSCVIWFDKDLKIGMFEPVGTHPDYTRKGLGKELIIEGLRRLKNINAKLAYVESYGDSRYSFYNSVGFKYYDKDYPWVKIFDNNKY